MNLAKYFSKFYKEKLTIPDELNEIAANPDSFEKVIDHFMCKSNQ